MTEQNKFEAPKSSLETSMSHNTYQPQFFSTVGRIGRVRWLAYGMGFNMIVNFVSSLASAAGGQAGMIFGLIALAAQVVFWFVLAVRRLNDLNKSGWLSLLLLIPVVNLGFLGYLLFAPGDNETNQYGQAPNENTTGLIILASILPAVFIIGILAAIAIPAYSEYIERVKESQQLQQESLEQFESENR